MREPVRSRRRRGLKGATDGAQARGRAARQRQQWLSSRQSSSLRAVKPAGRGTLARAQSFAVAGNDDFRLDEGPGFRGKSDRQIDLSPVPAGTSPAPSRRVSCFWASRSPSRVANRCDSAAFRARCRRVSTDAAKRSPGGRLVLASVLPQKFLATFGYYDSVGRGVSRGGRRGISQGNEGECHHAQRR